MSGPARKIVQCETAQQALESLCRWFYEDRVSAEGCEPVLAANVPETYRHLLVHNEHMTRKLESYHGSPVTLRVLHERHDGNIYSRNVLLLCGQDKQVVEFGIVRIDMQFVPDVVQKSILGHKRPLGEILISENVLRRIEPKWYFRFEANSPMAAYFGRNHDGDVYGRVGTIYYEEQPAIELLEVVTKHKAS